MHFQDRKVLYFIKISLKFVSNGPMDNKLVNRRQTIVCTNADPVPWRIYAALGGDES